MLLIKASVTQKINYIGSGTLIIATSSLGSSTRATAVTINSGSDITQYLSDNTTIKTASYAKFKLATAASNQTSITINKANGKMTAKAAMYVLDKENNQVLKLNIGDDVSKYIKNVQANAAGTGVNFMEAADGYQFLQEDKVSTVQTEKAKAEAQLYDGQGNAVSSVGLRDYYNEFGVYNGALYSDSEGNNPVTTANIGKYVNKTETKVADDLSFSLHVGADSSSSNKITAKIQTMTSASLGIDALKSSLAGIVDTTGDKAKDAIDVIGDALQQVSTQRSALGAIQNRLEHTIKNLDNVVENTTSAESSIRDTDMATEMVKYSNSNILAQAGQSMLAQANQSNQGALALL